MPSIAAYDLNEFVERAVFLKDRPAFALAREDPLVYRFVGGGLVGDHRSIGLRINEEDITLMSMDDSAGVRSH